MSDFAFEKDMTPIVAAWMREQGLLVRPETMLWSLCDIVGCALNVDRLELRLGRRQGWRPLQDRIIAVELKLSRVTDVLHQAYNNLSWVDESYAAMPVGIARRVYGRKERWDKYWRHGIGLLAVDGGCSVLIPAGINATRMDGRVFLQVEKFFRERKRLAAKAAEEA